MTSFNYREIVVLTLNPVDRPLTRTFYCVDKATAGIVRDLAEQTAFPAWDKVKPTVWYREQPKESLWVSKTARGWLASRGYGRLVTRTLSHRSFLMPILFPDPEMALAAAELCYPQPHPALSWAGPRPARMSDADAQRNSAFRKVAWEQPLKNDAWMGLAIRSDREQGRDL